MTVEENTTPQLLVTQVLCRHSAVDATSPPVLHAEGNQTGARRRAAAAGLSQHTTQPLLPPGAFTHSKIPLVLLEVFLDQTPRQSSLNEPQHQETADHTETRMGTVTGWGGTCVSNMRGRTSPARPGQTRHAPHGNFPAAEAMPPRTTRHVQGRDRPWDGGERTRSPPRGSHGCRGREGAPRGRGRVGAAGPSVTWGAGAAGARRGSPSRRRR